MANEHHDSQIRISNWTLATGTRPGERTPPAVASRRTKAYVALALSWLVLTATAATAQQSGGSTTETVTTIRSRDLNGTVAVNEQTVTHRAQTNDGDEVIIETYSPSMEGGRLALSRRVHRTTTATGNETQTVEETEERNPVAPAEPLRVIRRSVTTVRPSGTDSYVSERQVFELDVNGQLVPVLTQIERTSRN
jgi:hypothetical protein